MDNCITIYHIDRTRKSNIWRVEDIPSQCTGGSKAIIIEVCGDLCNRILRFELDANNVFETPCDRSLIAQSAYLECGNAGTRNVKRYCAQFDSDLSAADFEPRVTLTPKIAGFTGVSDPESGSRALVTVDIQTDQDMSMSLALEVPTGISNVKVFSATGNAEPLPASLPISFLEPPPSIKTGVNVFGLFAKELTTIPIIMDESFSYQMGSVPSFTSVVEAFTTTFYTNVSIENRLESVTATDENGAPISTVSGVEDLPAELWATGFVGPRIPNLAHQSGPGGIMRTTEAANGASPSDSLALADFIRTQH